MTISEINSHLLFPIENKNFTDFSPICFGAERCFPQKTCSCLRNYYLIHFICNGKGFFENHNGKMKVDAGQAFLIRPDEICTYTADEKEPWIYIWIGFEGKLAKHFDNVDDVFEIDEEIMRDLFRCIDMEAGREEYLIGILFRLYGNFFGKKLRRDKIKQVTDFINANYMRNIKISDMADMVGMNRKSLLRSFKEKCGTTIKDYLIEKRLSEAKKLLERGKGVAETGLMVGYSDAFVFSKMFKKRFGISPLEHKNLFQ